MEMFIGSGIILLLIGAVAFLVAGYFTDKRNEQNAELKRQQAQKQLTPVQDNSLSREQFQALIDLLTSSARMKNAAYEAFDAMPEQQKQRIREASDEMRSEIIESELKVAKEIGLVTSEQITNLDFTDAISRAATRRDNPKRTNHNSNGSEVYRGGSSGSNRSRSSGSSSNSGGYSGGYYDGGSGSGGGSDFGGSGDSGSY